MFVAKIVKENSRSCGRRPCGRRVSGRDTRFRTTERGARLQLAARRLKTEAYFRPHLTLLPTSSSLRPDFIKEPNRPFAPSAAFSILQYILFLMAFITF
jgi:hypothetical protein